MSGLSQLERLANDPAVRAALAKIPCAASTIPVSERAPAGKRALPRVAGTTNDKMSAPWDSPQYRNRQNKLMRRGHAVRELIEASLALLGQRVASGKASDESYERLLKAVKHLDSLPK
jgi:hypothetical protein